MTAVGSPVWAARTQGTLGVRDQLLFAFARGPGATTSAADRFTEAMRAEAEQRPNSRAGSLWRLGMARAIRRTRFPVEVIA